MSHVLEIERLRIQNLFSYYAPDEPIEFDFQGADPDNGRNVIIIAGRNGYGKTSLLNCLRLLLFGAAPWVQKIITRGLSPNVSLNYSTFLLGQPGYWDGVFNTQARNVQSRYLLELTWRESGGTVTITREWTVSGNVVDESFRITSAGAIPVPSNKNDFIEQRLPPYFATFYLFDGEELQRLAETFSEASENKRTIRQLLGIQRIDDLKGVLDEIARSLPRRARVAAMQGDLQKEEEDERRVQISLETLDAKEKEVRADVARIERQLNAINAELADLRQQGINPVDTLALQNEAKAIEHRLSKWLQDFGRDFIPTTPLLANPEMVQAAHRHAMSALQKPTDVTRRLVSEIRESVLASFKAPPFPTPPLTPTQQEFYHRRLDHKLKEFITSAESSDLGMFSGLSSTRLQSLVDRLGPHIGAHEIRRNWLQRLQQVIHDQSRLTQIQHQLQLAPATNDSVKSRYEELIRRQTELQTEKGAAAKFLDNLPSERRNLSQRLGQIRARLQALRADLLERRRLAERGRIAQELADGFFNDYVRLLERTLYSRVGTTTTDHWHQLMESHELVHRVELDNSLRLRFKDITESDVGMGSLSEGMKQIAATAFLWALADATGRRFPVVIDTPLGRIDLGHQKRILTGYVPRAARQVILLPTDSELDDLKYALLKPHVYREYYLTNPTGRSTRPVLGSLWEKRVRS